MKTPVSKAVASAKTSSAKITKDVPEASPRVSGRARKILDYNAMAKGEVIKLKGGNLGNAQFTDRFGSRIG